MPEPTSFPEAGPSTAPNRPTSRSITSGSRPTISITAADAKRAQSYHSPSNSHFESTPAPVDSIPSLLTSPAELDLQPNGKRVNVRAGIKRRVSTPRIGKLRLNDTYAYFDVEEDLLDRRAQKDGSTRFKAVSPEGIEGGGAAAKKDKPDKRQGGDVGTRARSTSTSIILPSIIVNPTASSSINPHPQTAYAPQTAPPQVTSHPTPSYAPLTAPPTFRHDGFDIDNDNVDKPTSLLTSAYNLGESSFLRLAHWIKPPQHHLVRRDSSDSEKGVKDGERDEELETSESSGSTVRTSVESSSRGGGRYWMNEGRSADSGYFSLPPTPPGRSEDPGFSHQMPSPAYPTLPTPALSTSLSKRSGWKGSQVIVERDGWWALVYRVWRGITPQSSGGKAGELIRESGWTVALMGAVFVGTAIMAVWMIQCMPITQLEHIPSSTTDLQLLSTEIRSYMSSSDTGWYHTVGVLTFVGCWKHAWSVPGAVILNILVGSVLEPIPALALLTIITATGSLFSYLLSRPLAPLIAVLFPKPLSLVRAALAPESIPSLPASAQSSHHTNEGERITPIQLSSDPASPPIGATSNSSVWRRLLIMRAMGFVPWSGMNVACGVVGVDWKIFWLTTAAGSASWSYVTASVGNILSRLAIPSSHADATLLGEGNEILQGESLTSLLRDPTLIAKLVFLSGLTLLPVVIKRRSNNSSSSLQVEAEVLGRDGISPDAPYEMNSLEPFPRNLDHLDHLAPLPRALSRLDVNLMSPILGTPSSPLTKSLTKFTPTPAVFDIMSFGRTAARQGLSGAAGIGKKVVVGLGVSGSGGSGR